jgi:hypothetical protein
VRIATGAQAAQAAEAREAFEGRRRRVMRVLRSKKAIVVLVATLVAAGALAAVGISAVISRTVVADGQNIHYQIVRSVADGFDSGWHIHPGLAIVQVQEGSLQFTTQGNCTPKTLNAGETYIEVPYLPLRAVGTGRVAWTTTFLVRYEEAIQIPVPSPCP